MTGPILNELQNVSDLRALSPEALPKLAEEIRAFLIEKVTKMGGHLASNLGVVELTIALHRVFDTPKDRIIWDVGHQSYVHKLLTGRKDFDTLRTGDGLSGFTKRSESEFDPFGAGHSSTSLSAALGFAIADKLRGEDRYTVAVVGDGAFTGGMIHEALNNCPSDLPLIIILNENEMSISKNIGGFSRHIAKVRTSRGYYRLKRFTSDLLRRIPLCGNALYRMFRGAKRFVKGLIYDSNYFEDMGLYYLGPCDGNDIATTMRLLAVAKQKKRTTVIHCKTQKGKGMAEAEQDPGRYHGVPRAGGTPHTDPTFSEACGKALVARAEAQADICAITAAMADGTGLVPFREAYPDRFFDVGIAEPHALTFGAGLAAAGMRPVFAVYSTFLQRGYDNLLHDVALQNLPLTICVDRAGLNVGDGATHHGIFDVAFLSQIPRMRLYAPALPSRVGQALDLALAERTPCAIRYASGYADPMIEARFSFENGVPMSFVCDFSEDKVPDAVILTYGKVAHEAICAADAARARGIDCGVVLLEQLKPVLPDEARLLPILRAAKKLVYLEEGIRAGGAGMLLLDAIRARGVDTPCTILAIDDDFVEVMPGGNAFAAAGIGKEDILRFL